MKHHTCPVLAVILLMLVGAAAAQTSPTSAAAASAQIPRVIRFSGIARDEAGQPMTGVLNVRFALYQDERGGAPLWLETQNVQADGAGHYTALLGSATTDGVPLDLFSSAEVHWMGVQVSGHNEQPRTMLLSVPYALKAADAETLGGLPASAFVQANPSAGASSDTAKATPNVSLKSTGNAPAPAATITGSGTTDFIPLWTSSTNLGNSILFQTGGNVGVGTKAPGAKLDTTGSAIAVRGTSSGATGTGVFGKATSTTGVNFGVQGQTTSTASGAAGVNGNENATTGQVFGVSGSTSSTTQYAAGVTGYEGAATGQVFGVSGTASSSTTNAMGVSGYESATKGQVYGVDGYSASTGPFAAGVGGFEGATTGQVYGVVGGATSSTNGSAGLSGFESATTGQVYGVSGGTNSKGEGSAAINGYEGATTGQVYGVMGTMASTGGAGVLGTALATSGYTNGVYGSSASPNGTGVSGNASATSGAAYGVSGTTASPNGSGIFGINNSSGGGTGTGVTGITKATTGQSVAVYGQSASTSGQGVNGSATATTGNTSGVYGGSQSTSGTGVTGVANATTGNTNGVYGTANSPNGNGVFGLNSSSGSSLLGNGVFGLSTASSGASWGVKGASNSANGVGVEGYSFAVGVRGQGLFCGSSGCVPEPADAGQFITASGGNILHGFLNTAGTWTEMFRVDSSGNGYFAGNLNIKGTLSKGGGSFKIDDPLDPAHKYLSHSFVESPDMMNVYNGNITTDRHGLAIVILPDYFEALNTDFRYQLTVIGQFAQAIVAKKITDNRFVIRTNKPGVEVSWQVTGIRHDAYANAYRIPVEQEKPPQEQGHYLHPELFGASERQAIGAAVSTPASSGDGAEGASRR